MEILDKLEEEINELRASLKNGSRKEIREEIGDMILVMANLCRFLTVDFESSFREALLKFARRFDLLSAEVACHGRSMEDYSIDELEEIWQKLKQENRRQKTENRTV